ncbi:cytochrome P450 [Amycolatopsis sp. 195334CR]|uniref:cytochrome P450 n=1 Tax=Amycolatopsis sp. 195334CR TaxID=2814588 RepID=UPI001A8C7A5C|nr:cytochrome P450 [Amycolatopsis sp. 195334CR]MBN6040833.1 cytochrome P450 [Amycolatopsis sp. 195334CR]
MSSCKVADGQPHLPPARDRRQAACPKELSVYNLILRPTAAREQLTALTERAAVHWDPYVSAWLICGTAEASLVLTDERFSSKRLNVNGDTVPSPDTTESTMDAMVSRMMLLKDGAEHLRLKKVARAVLTPQRIQALEPSMRELAAELLPLDKPGDLDFVEHVAKEFPLRVLGELLGIDESDLDMVLAGSDAITAIVSGLDHTIDPEIHRRARTLYEYAFRLVRERRENPGDDGISALVRAADDEGLADADIAANLVMLIASGHQTMPGFLSISLHSALTSDASALELPGALANVTPSRFVGRVATADIDVGGCRIRAGDKVLVLLAAANWHRGSADRGQRHLAFGYGRHRCAGAAMAELEGAVMFERMTEAMRAGVRLADAGVEWNNDANLPSLTKLPIRLGKTSKASTPLSDR